MNTTEVLDNKEALASVRNVMREVIMSANAMGYDFDVEEQMHIMVSRTKATALDYSPSM